jgi:methionyl-tRNA formyltransferase
MRIVFMGTPEFAIPSLTALLEHKYNLVAVITAPDTPKGRGQKLSSSPVKDFALRHGLQVLQPVSLRAPEFIDRLRELSPDLIVVVAFRILPREVFELPKFGSINLHASLLPKYRGAAPINWAIMKGETETGVTTFFLKEKVDTGNIILQARTRVGEDETAGELRHRLAAIGGEIVLQTVRLIELGKANPRAQDESLASPAPKIERGMCLIDWARSRDEVHNLIRGLSPDPCAFTFHNGKLLNIYRSRRVEFKGAVNPGEVVARTKNELLIGTGDGALALEEVQIEGKKRMKIEEFLRGYRIEKGDRLG